MADRKVIVHIGEDYVTGNVLGSFLNDDEANGRNGDAFHAAANTQIEVWTGAAWTAWTPNTNDNDGVDVAKLGMATATLNFGPSIQFMRLFSELWSTEDELLLFKYAANASLVESATVGTWGKDATTFLAGNEVYSDMLTEWTQAKADKSTDVLRVQAIIISLGKTDGGDATLTAGFQEELERFIKDVRYDFLEDADDDPIPIILTRIGLTGAEYDDIRDAQDAMASKFAYVDVLSTDSVQTADSSDHHSGLGIYQFGSDIYNAYLTVTDGDDHEAYNLASLRTEIRNSFGIKATDSAKTALIDRKINEALLWIASKRSDWPWLLREFAIDIPASRTETVSITQGERAVTGLTSSTKLRDVLVTGTTTTVPLEGYLISRGNATDGFSLQSKYLDDTISSGSVTIVQGYFQLPRDFARMLNLELLGADTEERIVYKNNLLFDKTKRTKAHQRGLSLNIKSFYTVKPDPLGKDDYQYATVYPYVSESRVLHGVYYKVPTKLVSAQNTPDIPRAQRFALLHAALWFMASDLKLDAERLTFYRVQALQSLQTIQSNMEFSEEPDIEPDLMPTRFISMPSGYPNPGNFHA